MSKAVSMSRTAEHSHTRPVLTVGKRVKYDLLSNFKCVFWHF